MKIRTDFVTNSSSSSFTLIRMESPTLDAWVRENYETPLSDLLDDFAQFVDSDGNGRRFSEDGGPAECLRTLLAGDEDDDWDEDEEDSAGNYFQELIDYLAQNGEKIDAEATGGIYCINQFECDPVNIHAVEFSHGRFKHYEPDAYGDILEQLFDDPDADWMDPRAFTPDVIHKLAKLLGQYEPLIDASEEKEGSGAAPQTVFSPSDEIAPIRTNTEVDPQMGNTITVEMTLHHNGQPVYLLEHYYDAMPSVQFFATTESVWPFFTSASLPDKERNKFRKNLKKIQIERQDVMFADVVTYKGKFKKQLGALHEAVIKEAEKNSISVKFKWEIK